MHADDPARSRSRTAPCRHRAATSSDPELTRSQHESTASRQIEASSVHHSWLNCRGHEESICSPPCWPPRPYTLKPRSARLRPPEAGKKRRSVVRDLLDHRLRSGDQRARRRGPVARLWGRRRRSVRETRRRRRGHAGVRESSIRSQGDRAARAGAVARRSRQAHHRRRSRTRHAAGRGDRHQGPLRRLHRQARHRSQLRSRRISCISAATPATSPARISPRRATRSPAPRSSKRWPRPIATARARWPSA